MQKPNILFHLNSSKKDTNGESPIYLRITIAKERASVYTGHKAKPGEWNTTSQRINGKSEKSVLFEAYADTIRFRILQIQNELLATGQTLTPKAILNRISNKVQDTMTLLQAFKRHNSDIFSLIGKDITRSTYNRYLVTERKIQAFLKSTWIIRRY
jgi:hypothetical protein